MQIILECDGSVISIWISLGIGIPGLLGEWLPDASHYYPEKLVAIAWMAPMLSFFVSWMTIIILDSILQFIREVIFKIHPVEWEFYDSVDNYRRHRLDKLLKIL